MTKQKDELAVLAREFAAWRAGKKGGEEIPARLWDLACAAALTVGPSKVAEVASLNGSALSQQMKLRSALAGETLKTKSKTPAAPKPPVTSGQRPISVTKIVSVSLPPQQMPDACVEIVSLAGWSARVPMTIAGADFLKSWLTRHEKMGVQP